MLPWLKVGHEQYRNSEFRAKASAVARCAYLELVMVSAQQSPIHSIPNDDAVLAGWSGIAIKQWLKVRDAVLSQFTLGDDGRFYCDMLVELYSNQREAKQDDHQQDNNQDNDKPLTNAERCRRYRNNRNNTSDMSTDTTADTGDMSTDTTATRDRHNEKVSQHESNMSKSVEMGGRGGDLDSELKQDLDLNQEVKNSLSQNASEGKNKLSQNFFDDELKPNLKVLNDKFIGEITVTQEMIDSQLFLFNAHYETQQLTDNQRLAKWVSWIKRKVVDEKIAETRSQKITVPPRRTPTPDNFAAKNYSAGINTDGSF